MKKEMIEEFLDNNVICEVKKQIIPKANISETFVVLKSITNNEIVIPFDDYSGNKEIKNKILLDFYKIFNSYYDKTKDVVIKRNLKHDTNYGLCYGIELKKEPSIQLCFFDQDKEAEVIETQKLIEIVINSDSILSKSVVLEADIRNAFNNILLYHLSYNDSIVDYSNKRKRGTFPYEEKLQLDDMSVTVLDATISAYFSVNSLSYHDDVERHNKEIEEAKKMQLKFKGM